MIEITEPIEYKHKVGDKIKISPFMVGTIQKIFTLVDPEYGFIPELANVVLESGEVVTCNLSS